jgi:hypothetical protein
VQACHNGPLSRSFLRHTRTSRFAFSSCARDLPTLRDKSLARCRRTGVGALTTRANLNYVVTIF